MPFARRPRSWRSWPPWGPISSASRTPTSRSRPGSTPACRSRAPTSGSCRWAGRRSWTRWWYGPERPATMWGPRTSAMPTSATSPRSWRSALPARRSCRRSRSAMALATPVVDVLEGEKRFPHPYVVDDKYEGVRAQGHKDGDRVELYARTFDGVASRFPELVEPLRAIPGTFVLDAEVIAFDPAG